MNKSKTGDALRLIVSIVVCQLAGGAGSVFTAPSISTWYITLRKPAFTPPNWVFAPVSGSRFLFSWEYRYFWYGAGD